MQKKLKYNQNLCYSAKEEKFCLMIVMTVSGLLLLTNYHFGLAFSTALKNNTDLKIIKNISCK